MDIKWRGRRQGCPGSSKQARRNSISVLDLVLPDIDGFAVLDALLDKRPEQQVLVMSALSDVGSKVRCLEFGAVDYLAKPFELPELIARVRRRTRHEENGAERHLVTGEVSLDLQRRRVTINGGAPIALPTREFLLLEYIMRKAGEVCGREEARACLGLSVRPGDERSRGLCRTPAHKLGHTAIETVRNVGIASWARKYWLEAAWVAFAAVNIVAILFVPDFETVPFHFVWVSFTLLYGLRVWGMSTTFAALGGVCVFTGIAMGWS